MLYGAGIVLLILAMIHLAGIEPPVHHLMAAGAALAFLGRLIPAGKRRRK